MIGIDSLWMLMIDIRERRRERVPSRSGAAERRRSDPQGVNRLLVSMQNYLRRKGLAREIVVVPAVLSAITAVT